eukprot:8066748-Karenia_brevis.AAC.1
MKQKWTHPQTHSAACRERIAEELMKDRVGRLRVQQAETRGGENNKKKSEERSEPNEEKAPSNEETKMSTDDGELDVDPAKWEAFQRRIGQKRQATDEGEAAPAKRENRSEAAHGEKRKSEIGSSSGESSKSTKLNSIMRKLNKRDRQILGELNNIAEKCNDPDVCEIYSPPRVTQHTGEFGLTAGWSLDLTTYDTDGRAWDFNQADMRERAIRKVEEDKPLVVIGSPMCTNFSTLMNANWARMDPKQAEARWLNAVAHMNFVCKIYQMQIEAGRYFVHEHPTGATSWKLPSIIQLLNTHGVLRTSIHMCAYGMTSCDHEGTGLVYKPTSFATNSPHIANQLSRRCSNTNGRETHRHVHLVNGRAKFAQVYPPDLCRAICQGIYDQKQDDKRGVYMIGSIEVPKSQNEIISKAEEAAKLGEKCHVMCEENPEEKTRKIIDHFKFRDEYKK